MTHRLPLLAALILPFLACAKKTDYLYYYNRDKSVVFEHKLKELTGNSGLDILWVIDNSASMRAHQQTVIANMNSFVDGLVLNKSLQWKMGLISTTDGESPYVGFAPGDTLDSSSPDAAGRFKRAVGRLGLDGDSIEKEYDPIMTALHAYPGFLRPSAYLAIIVVSDAPEQSRRSTTQFLQEITALKGKLSNVLLYAFVNPVDWCTPTDDVFNWQGSKLEVLLRQVQGGAYKLCDPDFGQNVANLGAGLARQVTSPRIDLKDKPIASTLKVWHGTQEIPGGTRSSGGYWEYDVRANAIIFNDLSFAPNDNEKVRVTYDVDENFK